MAYSNSSNDRMEDFRFHHSQQSPRNESPLPFSGLTSPNRNGRLPPPLNTHDTGRVNLTRRFTTDSGRVPTITSIASQRGIQAPEQDFQHSTTLHKVQLIEKRKQEHERLREQKRRFEAEMLKIELINRQEEQELQQQMHDDLIRTTTKNNMNQNGHQSEPSTPPEYRETSSGFPSVFSRPNRYSTSSITSPPGLYNRPGRSGSQLTSPQSGIVPSRHFVDEVFSPQSFQGSRRGSDDDDKQEAVRQDPTSYRSSNTSNRYSMPVTKSRNPIQDLMDHDLDQTNTAEFLFGGDEEPRSAIDNFFEKNAANNHFPILVNRNANRNANEINLSASHLALDLAIESSASPEPQSYSFAQHPRHRASNSTNTNGLMSFQDMMKGQGNTTPKSVGQSTSNTNPQNGRNSYTRASVDMTPYMGEGNDALAAMTSPKHVSSTPPKLQSSYSANDIPTMKNGSGDARNYSIASPNSHAQQYLHQHNVSTGRFPTNTMNNRHSRELSGDTVREPQGNGIQSIQSALHASAPPFSFQQPRSPQGMPPSNFSTFGNQYAPAYEGYNSIQMLTGAMQNMQIPPIPDMRMVQNGYNGPQGYNSQMYGNYGGFPPGAMQPYGGQNGGYVRHDSQARVIEGRRKQDNEKMAQFRGQTVQNFRGQIYDHCKDQYGCRFLQQVIDHNNPDDVYTIWLETKEHVVELMMDPFGNYLCQKLFELCQEPERTVLIQNAAEGPNMYNIAVSPHGTRALQKMIEFAEAPEQQIIIIDALKSRVVELIKDLNGNHVIQKCLTKFSPEASQFIFDAVADQCIAVGTHRHGCCVLQRCIDHSKGEQKAALIRAITNNSKALVQDAFGNYVIQYILDLQEQPYIDAIILTFKGKIQVLSTQKFSSNVIEKCIRTASESSKQMIMDELTQKDVLRVCATDSFANYVIQTALDHTSGEMRHRLVEALRPLLAQIRNQPCGRRIMAKMEGDARKGAHSGHLVPNEQGQVPLPRIQQHYRGNLSNGNNFPTNGANGFERNGIQNPRQMSNGAAPYNGNNGNGHPEQTFAYRGSFGAPPANGDGAPF